MDYLNKEYLDLEDLLETHFEIATRLDYMASLSEEEQPKKFAEMYLNYGRGGLYMEAQKLSLKFQEIYKHTLWGEELDWIDTIETFLDKNL